MPGGKTMKWGWWALCLLLQSVHATTTTTTTHATSKGDSLGGFCFWTRTLADGRTHQTFLRWEKGGQQLVLYHGLWGSDGHLQQCVVSRDAAITHGYLSECQQDVPERLRAQQKRHSRRRGQKQGRFSPTPLTTFGSTHIMLQQGVCEEFAEGFAASGDVDTHMLQTHTPVRHPRDLQSRSGLEEGSGSLRRSKRGVMMIPGTLWCGSGNTAANYTDLGTFSQTDQCCREHDHCQYTITSFRSGYGVFNTNIFTLSHCECDNRFKQCLQKAEDSMAGIVGYGYFNLLKMRCFEWSQRMECTQRTWWGRCVSSDLKAYAVVQEPTDFNATLPANSSHPYLNLHVTMEAGLGHTEPHPGQTTDLTTLITDQSPSATRSPQTIMSATTIRNSKIVNPDLKDSARDNSGDNQTDETYLTVNPTQNTKTDRLDNRTDVMIHRTEVTDVTRETVGSIPNVQTTMPNSTEYNSVTDHPVTAEPEPSGPQHMCNIYKFLDDCRLQVPPLQELFGLRNTELRTLYHCNCTKRLAEHLPVLQERELHAALLDFVSNSCFTLPHTQSTDTPHNRAVLQRMPFINARTEWDKKAKGRRHLLDRVGKVSQSKRAKRKDWGVRLYRKCLRMHSRVQQRQKRH